MENQPKTPCPPREEIFRHYGYPEDTPDKCSYILYKRTSAMNSSEMSHLIDGARQEARELGIDI